MVARPEGSYGRADLVNDTDALMTENAAWLASRNVPLEDVQIGAANGRFGHFNNRVSGRRDIGLRTAFQRLLSRPLIYEGFHHAGCCALRAGFRFWRRHEVHGLLPFI